MGPIIKERESFFSLQWVNVRACEHRHVYTWQWALTCGGGHRLGSTVRVLVPELTSPYFHLPTVLNLQVEMEASSSCDWVWPPQKTSLTSESQRGWCTRWVGTFWARGVEESKRFLGTPGQICRIQKSNCNTTWEESSFIWSIRKSKDPCLALLLPIFPEFWIPFFIAM